MCVLISGDGSCANANRAQMAPTPALMCSTRFARQERAQSGLFALGPEARHGHGHGAKPTDSSLASEQVGSRMYSKRRKMATHGFGLTPDSSSSFQARGNNRQVGDNATQKSIWILPPTDGIDALPSQPGPAAGR